MALEAEETRRLLEEVPSAYRTRIDEVLLTAVAEALSGWSGGGPVRVDSIVGRGTSVTCDFPVDQAAQRNAAE